MIFCSPVFLFLFLPLVLGLYFVLPHRFRNSLLLAASLFFYLWGEKAFLAILLASVAANYVLGLWIDRVHGRRLSGWVMGLAVCVNLGLLGWFKYAHFFAENVNRYLTPLGLPPISLGPIHLPLGISFFTFHALSYVIDVYRREAPALRNPLRFALYISFFPQAIAGPIVRYGEIASQLARRAVTWEGFAEGVRRFIVGLAKKMIVANTLAAPADAVFGLPGSEWTAGLTWFAAVCYALQIYFDFSGYSDMAVGLARMFGFRFPENFNYPYVSRSVTEFWRRWHISLSSWFRDYLYIPLGGNRVGAARRYANLVTVFALCGLWHGASKTFLFWGLYHGAFLVLERAGLGRRLERGPAPVRHGYTLLAVLVGWVFFRAATFHQALGFLAAMAGMGHGDGVNFHPGIYCTPDVLGALVAGMVGCTPVVPALARRWARLSASGRAKGAPGWLTEPVLALMPVATLGLLLVVSGMLLAGGTYNPFIYFRF